MKKHKNIDIFPYVTFMCGNTKNQQKVSFFQISRVSKNKSNVSKNNLVFNIGGNIECFPGAQGVVLRFHGVRSNEYATIQHDVLLHFWAIFLY